MKWPFLIIRKQDCAGNKPEADKLAVTEQDRGTKRIPDMIGF